MPRDEKAANALANNSPDEHPAAGFRLWLLILVFRMFNAVIMRTYFDADEHWQSLEVAHRLVFGYGWLTWEWHVGLRSYLYILPFAIYFWILKALGLDHYTWLVSMGPRVLIQATIAASTDYLLYLFTYRLFKSRHMATAALLMSLLNWFNFAYSTRTLSNNFEAFLTLLTVMNWPINRDQQTPTNYTWGFFFLGLSILNRPSALTHWICPVITAILTLPGWTRKTKFVLQGMVMTVVCISLGLLLDSTFYGRWTLSWWNFFDYNVLRQISNYYGVYSWHYYLLLTIPAYLGLMIPLVIISLLKSPKHSPWLFIFILGSVLFNSLLPHKELRFLYPVMPFLMILSGQGYVCLHRNLLTGLSQTLKNIYLISLLIFNLGMGVFFATIHKGAPLPLLDYLREEVDQGRVTKIYFAARCHSTPYYAYLHRAIPMEFITCDPPINNPGLNYISEAGKFDLNPVEYLKSHVPVDTSHLVIINWKLEEEGMQAYLESLEFEECNRFLHQLWDPEVGKREEFIVFCR